MPTREIVCANCRLSGEIEVRGLDRNIPAYLMFRHLGHNPFSGHMHYQCPACEMVLLVNPIDILMRGPMSSLPGRLKPGRESRWTAGFERSDLSLLKRFFRRGGMEH